jgi:IS30 family transposase
MKSQWTEAEILRLRELAATMTALEISTELGRHYSTVIAKLRELRVRAVYARTNRFVDPSPADIAERCAKMRRPDLGASEA